MKNKSVFIPAILIILIAGCHGAVSEVSTEFGKVAVNRSGEYIVKDWDTFLKLFTEAVADGDRQLLKSLCGSEVSYDEPLPDGSMRIWRDETNKIVIDRIDLGLAREMLGKNLYSGFYRRGLYRGETRYFADRENPEHSWMMTFRKARDGGWKFYSLWYVGEHQNF